MVIETAVEGKDLLVGDEVLEDEGELDEEVWRAAMVNPETWTSCGGTVGIVELAELLLGRKEGNE